MSLTQVWRVQAGLTLLTLESLPDGALEHRYSKRTRTVASQFAHIHSVRVHHLKGHGGREFLGDLETFGRGAEPSYDELHDALVASSDAMERLIAKCEAAGKVSSWKGRPPETYVAYHVAHEAHHRALVLVSLRASGEKTPEPLKFGLWEGWKNG